MLACVAMNVHVRRVVFEWCGCREFVHQFLDSSSHQNSPCDLWAQSGRWCWGGLEGHGPGRLSAQPGIGQSEEMGLVFFPSVYPHLLQLQQESSSPNPWIQAALGAAEVAGASSDVRPQEVPPASILFRKPTPAPQHVLASLLEDKSQASPGEEPSQPSSAHRGPTV